MTMLPAPFETRLSDIEQERKAAVVDGVETAYWLYGSQNASELIVMVHGFRGDHHGLESFASELADQMLCVIPDLPGFGESADFPSAASINNYATWLASFVAYLGHKGRVIILGHSFGSIVVAAALAQGLIADDVVLVNPIAKNALQGPRGIMTRLAVFYYWLAAVLPNRLGFALLRSRSIVRVMSATMAKTRDKDLRAWIHDQHDRYFSHFHSRKAVLQAFRTSVGTDVSQFQAALQRPILLLVSELDDITDLETQMEFASRLPECEIHTVGGVGHLIHYEAYEWASSLILKYVSRGDTRA